MRKLMEFIKDVAEDERIPLQNRIVLGGLLLYLLTPVDILPDFVPILGWLDDAFITLLVLDYVFSSADTHLILQHYPWNKQNFEKIRGYVERLTWLVPKKVKRLFFAHASRLALHQGTPELTDEHR